MEQTDLDNVLKSQYSVSMEFNVLPLFKSHFSLGKSILTLDKPMEVPAEEEDRKKDEYLIRPDSVLEICRDAGIKKFFLVDDSISGFLQAYRNSEASDLEMVFGLRLVVTDDIDIKDDSYKKRESRIVLIAKNAQGYNDLVKISTLASTDGFYYRPRIDAKNLKRFVSDNIVCMVPFYDSFLYQNNFKISQCCADFLGVFDKENIVFSTESNDLPFDESLLECVTKFTGDNGYKTIKTKSIYYKNRKDFIPYLTFRCIHNRTALQKPNLEHFCSKEFCFESWKEQNENQN